MDTKPHVFNEQDLAKAQQALSKGINVSIFAPVVSEHAGTATGIVTISKTDHCREAAA